MDHHIGSTHSLLYCPTVVNDTRDKIACNISSKSEKGLIVPGPPSSGKSCSLMNTVMKLESTGNHLVAFIPDGHSFKLTVD
jgi:type II secretory ATPase GspE/PulE/Tfp pilus assembly ATPase PilB-like protein